MAYRKQWKSYLSHVPTNSAGVAIIFGAKFKEQIVSVLDILPSRMLKVDVTLYGVNLSFFNIYAPNIRKERMLFFEKLHMA